MPRFLSRQWFDEVAAATDGDAPPPDALVLEQVVNGTPYGRVTYLVLVADGRAVIRPTEAETATQPSPDLTITCDWETASAIAKGELSAQRALMQGRLRIRGSAAALGGRASELAGIDPVPPEVRKNTTF